MPPRANRGVTINLKRGGGGDVSRMKKSTGKVVKKLDFRFKKGKDYSIKPEPFPRVLKTAMKYSWTEANFAVNAFGTVNWNTFRCNTIYRPDLTAGGGGNTVCGHNVMASIYQRYLVTGAKVSISFNDPSADGIRIGYRIRHAAAAPVAGSTLRQLVEQPMTYMSGISNSGLQTKTFNFFVRPWSLLGISKLEYMANSSSYSSAISALPSGTLGAQDGCVFDIFAINENPLAAAQTIHAVVKIKYYVTLYNRQTLSSS